MFFALVRKRFVSRISNRVKRYIPLFPILVRKNTTLAFRIASQEQNAQLALRACRHATSHILNRCLRQMIRDNNTWGVQFLYTLPTSYFMNRNMNRYKYLYLAHKHAGKNNGLLLFLYSRIPNIDPNVLAHHFVKMCMSNNVVVAQYLLPRIETSGISYLLNPYHGIPEAISWAAELGHLDIIKYLHSLPPRFQVDLRQDQYSLVTSAAQEGHFDVGLDGASTH